MVISLILFTHSEDSLEHTHTGTSRTTPGVTLSYTSNNKVKGGEQFVIRGAAVIMSDLWENQILIECWKPPPELVSVHST